jgi:hypothetical protein
MDCPNGQVAIFIPKANFFFWLALIASKIAGE